MLNLWNTTDSPVGIVKILFDKLDIDVPVSVIEEDLEFHPDYPSLLSLSDVLKNHGIDNIGLRTSRSNIGELGRPLSRG